MLLAVPQSIVTGDDGIAIVSWSEVAGLTAESVATVEEPAGILETAGDPIGPLPPTFITAVPKQDEWSWQTLPEGLMWHSYMAGPHEPRISTVLFSEHEGGAFWDATLGGRVGLLRYGTNDVQRPQGWQWDLEGAVITRLDLYNSEDVESNDFRFGTELTKASGRWSLKFGYFHISSHVGDEYMERNPSFKRINYVTESLILGASYQAYDSLRLYGETAFAFKMSGGARPWQFQTGFEYVPQPMSRKWGGPFAAMNLDVREAVGYAPSLTAQAGWQVPGSRSGRRLRWGAQYSNGYSSQFEFFQRREQTIGGGIWFDY
ncbi:hypothetical protein Poly24_23690 [Rosistilla carotiformis]|uniref:DUF1207 domain-containing protein n=1 Tax=Rosistilla carotiformis TaxID=2528017 RepID=A0A518JSZ6_9BACT|nr:DUF1207 domain-containing protein [Rosistilla carotiformis]QDV68657.1 hypothetical protein Poly24_23690 [Rosistilla carotiformis]